MGDLEKNHILISIKPKYANKIVDGLKLVELRRKFPMKKDCYLVIYSSSPDKAIIGYTQIQSVAKLPVKDLWEKHKNHSYITEKDFYKYFEGTEKGFAISFKIVKKLFNSLNLQDLGIKPPQSYRYITDDIFQKIIATNKKSLSI
jgi:predicted transcriptional regulator